MTQEINHDFKTLKAELDVKRVAYHAGGLSYDDLLAHAQRTADAFNADAQRIAKQFKRRPKFITVAGLLR